MDNTVTLNGETYPTTFLELHLPEIRDVRHMFLKVFYEQGCFLIWGMELSLLKSIEDLDGQRIHLKPDGSAYEDDTLASDIFVAYDTSGANYWTDDTDEEGGCYAYGDILIDFKCTEGRHFHVHVEMTLTEHDDCLDEDNMTYPNKGIADFIVEADEKNPVAMD